MRLAEGLGEVEDFVGDSICMPDDLDLDRVTMVNPKSIVYWSTLMCESVEFEEKNWWLLFEEVEITLPQVLPLSELIFLWKSF